MMMFCVPQTGQQGWIAASFVALIILDIYICDVTWLLWKHDNTFMFKEL